MKTKLLNRTKFIQAVVTLYILLLTYAAVSKILDFQNFQIQIGQSPLLSAFAQFISYSVPIVEILLAFALMIAKTRVIALHGCLLLMAMFTAYIFIILNFSSFIPCSCGGILEKMSWTQHLIFNIIFVVLAAAAIALRSKTMFVYGYLAINLITGVATISILFLLSEDIIQHRNNFVRRLPEQISKIHDTNLGYNSYYFAGEKEDKIYLGNNTAPLLLTIIDTALNKKKEITVKLDKTDLPFRTLQIKVQSSHFYVYDGTVPCIFKGSDTDWKTNYFPIKNVSFFANPIFTDAGNVAYRTRTANGESILALNRFTTDNTQYVNPILLQKQIDGTFDVDGNLVYDSYTNTLVYTYYYRNQFIVIDSNLKLLHRGKTIDTVSKAKIKIAYNSESNEKKLAAPALMVNKNVYAYRGLLFVNSALLGKFEDAEMWKQSSMIDVYDIRTNTYLVSFYVYHIDGKKLGRFIVSDNKFYGMVGTHMVAYRLNDMILKKYSENSIE